MSRDERIPLPYGPAELPRIVGWALVHTVVDLGQLSKLDKKILNRYVKKGWLAKGRGGPFPALKTVYAHPDYDFALHRQEALDELHALAVAEKAGRIKPVYSSLSGMFK